LRKNDQLLRRLVEIELHEICWTQYWLQIDRYLASHRVYPGLGNIDRARAWHIQLMASKIEKRTVLQTNFMVSDCIV
jgi:hypothetical protein